MGGVVLFKVRTKSRQRERFLTPVESTKENTFPREIIPNNFFTRRWPLPVPVDHYDAPLVSLVASASDDRRGRVLSVHGTRCVLKASDFPMTAAK